MILTNTINFNAYLYKFRISDKLAAELLNLTPFYIYNLRAGLRNVTSDKIKILHEKYRELINSYHKELIALSKKEIEENALLYIYNLTGKLGKKIFLIINYNLKYHHLSFARSAYKNNKKVKKTHIKTFIEIKKAINTLNFILKKH